DGHEYPGTSADMETALEAQLKSLQGPDRESVSNEWMEKLVLALRLPRSRIEELLSRRSLDALTKMPGQGRHATDPKEDRAGVGRDDSVDVVIITIREDENRAVLDRVANQRPLPRRNRTYSVGVVDNAGGFRYRVAVVRTL